MFPGHHGLIEKTMAAMGAESVYWPFMSRCCGTFLSVSRPKIAEKQVNRIMQGAIAAGAECVVTACAMCHLNLEIRCLPENRIPIFHFSELLSLALEGKFSRSWLKRHLIDPAPSARRKTTAQWPPGIGRKGKSAGTAPIIQRLFCVSAE